MLNTLYAILALTSYCSVALMQFGQLTECFSPRRSSLILLTVLALITHAFLLHRWIDTPFGQNLASVTMFSFTLWVIVLCVFLTMLIRPVENLLIFSVPLAMLSIVLAMVFPEQRIVDIAEDAKQLAHIFLATVTFAVLCMAGLQALLLSLYDARLRHKKMAGVFMPPLETLESLLFWLIRIGFLLLTAVLITSVYAFHGEMTTAIIQKTVLVCLAWLVFSTLLIGRHMGGWRGRKAVNGTMVGVALLIVASFGIQLIH